MSDLANKIIGKLEEYRTASDKKYHYLIDNAELSCIYDKSDLEDMRKQTFKETISIVNQLIEENDNDTCEWKWGPDYANVQCEGDKILFGSRRLFTYCPYCSKKIKEI